MGLGSKMSAEMGLLSFTALLRCFEASTSVRAPPTRLAIMRAPGPAPLSPHALLSLHARMFGLRNAASAVAQRRGATLGPHAVYAAVLVASAQEFPALASPTSRMSGWRQALREGRSRRRWRLRGGDERAGTGPAVAHDHAAASCAAADASAAPSWSPAHA